MTHPTPLPSLARRQSLGFPSTFPTSTPSTNTNTDSSSSSTSTSFNLFANPTTTPNGVPISGGGTSALPSDVFIWIFVLIASGLVLLTALYRIWRLRQLNRSMSTFFRVGPPPAPAPLPLSLDPRHPNSLYWQAPYPTVHPPPPARTRVAGENVGDGGRRLDSGLEEGDGKDELPAYERGTLPGYGEAVGWRMQPGVGPGAGGGGYGYTDRGEGGRRDAYAAAAGRGRGRERRGGETSHPSTPAAPLTPSAPSAPAAAALIIPSLDEIRPQRTHTNPFRTD